MYEAFSLERRGQTERDAGGRRSVVNVVFLLHLKIARAIPLYSGVLRIALSATDCWARGATISRAPTTAASPGRPGSVARWLPYLSGAARAAAAPPQLPLKGEEGEREKEAEVDLDGCHAGRRECSRFLCRDSIVGAVGRPIHPSSGRQRARRAGLPFPTEDEDEECDHGGGVCWLSRPHHPRKPSNSTDKVSPHSPHRHCRRPSVRRSTCHDRFLSLIPSFIPDETGTSKTAMEGAPHSPPDGRSQFTLTL